MSRERGGEQGSDISQNEKEKIPVFFETKYFLDQVESIRAYLEKIQQKFQENENFFVHEPNLRTISYCLGKIILETPRLLQMFGRDQENFPEFTALDKARIEHRICACLTYSNKKKPGVPVWTYNLNLQWKWEDRLEEMLTM